ncbi:MAG TPA: cytochrome C [Usitatibacteraceae bacterium]|nr:cytochrome C [Usitatibacteraceae bacterium]
MKKTAIIVAATLAGLSLAAGAQELTWRKDVEPIVKKGCAECHGADAPEFGEWMLLPDAKRKKEGPRMDTYTTFMNYVVWPATGALQRRLDDGANAGGKPGNMYKYLGETDAERAANLKTIKAWLGDGAWNLNRFKARESTPGVTKEQLEKIKAKY